MFNWIFVYEQKFTWILNNIKLLIDDLLKKKVRKKEKKNI